MPPLYRGRVALTEFNGSLLDREPTDEKLRQASGFTGDHTTVLCSAQPFGGVGEDLRSYPRRLTPLRAVLG
jgi:hypothetical protein